MLLLWCWSTKRRFYEIYFDLMQMCIIVYHRNKEIAFFKNPLSDVFDYLQDELQEKNAGTPFKNKTLLTNFSKYSTLEQIVVNNQKKQVI